jgi:hypothetical protein
VYIRGSRFFVFFDFQFLTTEFGLKSKTKVEKAFFFIFKPSCVEMSFWDPKKSQIQNFFWKYVDMGTKNPQFYVLIRFNVGGKCRSRSCVFALRGIFQSKAKYVLKKMRQ